MSEPYPNTKKGAVVVVVVVVASDIAGVSCGGTAVSVMTDYALLIMTMHPFTIEKEKRARI